MGVWSLMVLNNEPDEEFSVFIIELDDESWDGVSEGILDVLDGSKSGCVGFELELGTEESIELVG